MSHQHNGYYTYVQFVRDWCNSIAFPNFPILFIMFIVPNIIMKMNIALMLCLSHDISILDLIIDYSTPQSVVHQIKFRQ